ncbi:MAG: carboxylating nicotinate-nucleotide diphosphorylase [Bacteroidetes bacterium]|nr:carboxylating nicotinate-nucleotide diphosphorylase [Bacteroidota bacterium]
MIPSYLDGTALQTFIRSALQEDQGEGDFTSLATIDKDQISTAELLVKSKGIIAGVELAAHILHQCDESIKIFINLNDGAQVAPGDIVFTATGSTQQLLLAERLLLNCMQRMSGIATYTSRLCQLVEGTNVKLLDTRKTTPLFRAFEKWAVQIGGGVNHRFNLSEQILIKDNHLTAAGSIGEAIRRTRNFLSSNKKNLSVEIEVQNLEQVKEAVALSPDVIMLDNMSPDQIKACLKLIGNACKVEASGGINEENIRSYAETGVDFISVGSLTHSYRSLDLSLKLRRSQV